MELAFTEVVEILPCREDTVPLAYCLISKVPDTKTMAAKPPLASAGIA
tara:strand:- start:324 stop:467 length:144 start_codon:yes stop_codon:yes gene_type:complete